MLNALMATISLSAIALALSVSANAIANPPANIDIPAGELIEALKSEIELVYQPEQVRVFRTARCAVPRRGSVEVADAARARHVRGQDRSALSLRLVVRLPTGQGPSGGLARRSSAEWFFRYLLVDEGAISARDRAVYAAAYSSREAIRAGTAWYQAFTQDIIDDGTYGKLTMPVLGLAGPGYEWLKAVMETKATDVRIVKISESGHFVAEEKPVETTRMMLEFFGK